MPTSLHGHLAIMANSLKDNFYITLPRHPKIFLSLGTTVCYVHNVMIMHNNYCKHWCINCTFLPKMFAQNQGCGLSARISAKYYVNLQFSTVLEQIKTIFAKHSVTCHKKPSIGRKLAILLQVWWFLKELFLFNCENDSDIIPKVLHHKSHSLGSFH